MKISRIARIGAIGAVAALALAGCAANEGGSGSTEAPTDSTLSGTIDATGASSQAAAQEAWVAAFQTANPDVTVNYEPTGSGTGRENFLEGGSNFIGSDRAFNDEEVAAGGFGACTTDDIVEVPLYISPVAVAFNLEGIDSLNLDAATIAGIFAGTISNWNAPEIAALNDGVERLTWPSRPCTAPTPRGRRRRSPSTSTPRRVTSGPTSRPTCGRSRVARQRRAPPA